MYLEYRMVIVDYIKEISIELCEECKKELGIDDLVKQTKECEVQEDVTVQDKFIDVIKELISDVMDEDERR